MKLLITSDKVNCTIEIDDPPYPDNITEKEKKEYISSQLDRLGKTLWFELSYKYQIV
jgi:hypothetical protein